MPRVLVPVAILKGANVSSGLTAFLSTVDVTVLGYHVVPDQTSPDQARMQYEERATSALEDITQEFQQAGGDADYRLVFTHDRRKSVQRIAEETNASAIVTTGATGSVERILVALSGDVAVDRILTFVAELVEGRNIGVTLFAAGKATDALREKVDAAATQLTDAGTDVRTEITAGPPFDTLIDAVPGHDVVVIGEKAPSLTSLLFGEESDRIATRSVSPVLVVRSNDTSDT